MHGPDKTASQDTGLKISDRDQTFREREEPEQTTQNTEKLSMHCSLLGLVAGGAGSYQFLH